MEDPIVNIAGLTYTFAGPEHHHARPPALQDIHFKIAPGDFVVITGPSGCGKSTLAMAIGGYLFQQYQGTAQGRVSVAGKDARHTPVYEMAEIVGLVQQNPEAQLCTLTVEDEIAFGLENHRVPPTEIDVRVDRALEKVNALHLRRRALRTLSGGEKQRVAIAAVLALEPQLLILDEPTSSLDPAGTAAVFEVIAAIRAITGITVIVIEHKLAYLMAFHPRIVRMEAGQIVSDRMANDLDNDHNDLHTIPLTSPPASHSQKPVSQKPVATISHLDIQIDERRILSDISLDLWPGEFVVVMGDNGSGKSTLLWALLGLRKPARGSVVVMGMDTAQTPVSTLAGHVGFVFQNPDHQLFANTVWEEATIAPKNLQRMDERTAERIHDMLAEAGLGDRQDDHPYRLSYGEKRRLNLISILGLQPRLLLLDEILIGQDIDNIGYILGTLQAAVARGATVVMVNHHPEIVRQVATRVLFLEEGRLTIDAPTEEAMRQLAQTGHTAYLPPSYAKPSAKLNTSTPPGSALEIGTQEIGTHPKAPAMPTENIARGTG